MPEAATGGSDGRSMFYHLTQYDNQKDSTLQFSKFISDYVKDDEKVFDVGTGAGAALLYLASVYKKTSFLGIDSEDKLIDEANRICSTTANLDRLRFQKGDAFDLGEFSTYLPDGVISMQTLSWLPDYKIPMKEVFEVLKPKWVAVTSLFYEGQISADTVITEHRERRKFFYNTISIPEFGDYANSHGYEIDKIEKYNINIDLQIPADRDYMSTYTKNFLNDSGIERIQISGPLLMNWYFVSLLRISR